jgi:uncharacterized OsmC-like protein
MMRIVARLSNTDSAHLVEVETNGRSQPLAIAPKPGGRGSAVNGAELLFAAVATCFCNDLHREASRRNIVVHGVDVEVEGTFGDPGQPARDVVYRVAVRSDAAPEVVAELVRATDALTEIQNTLRSGCTVTLLSAVRLANGLTEPL